MTNPLRTKNSGIPYIATKEKYELQRVSVNCAIQSKACADRMKNAAKKRNPVSAGMVGRLPVPGTLMCVDSAVGFPCNLVPQTPSWHGLWKRILKSDRHLRLLGYEGLLRRQ